MLSDRAAHLPDLDARTMTAVFNTALGQGTHVTDDASGVRLDIAQLHARALHMVAGLADLGVERQQPVLSMLDNHVDHVAVWAALGLGGFIGVPINTAFKGDLLVHVINDSTAEVMILDARYLDRVLEIAPRLEALKTVVLRGAMSEGDGRFATMSLDKLVSSDVADPEPVKPWDLHSVMYTSGTTGDSKGVMVSHAQTFTRAAVIDVRSRSSDRSISLVTLPLFHVVGQCRGLYSALIYGADAVITPRFSVSDFWPLTRRHGATYTSLLGSMASFIAKQPYRDDDADNPMELVVMAPTIPDVASFRTRFALDVVTSYGSTEAGSVTIGDASGPGCGNLHPEFEGRLVDEHDRCVEPGKPGELVLRARTPWTITAGYWRRPEVTADACRNLWFHTGDVFVERDGELQFVDRSKDMIRRRGENISAVEIEQAVERFPEVAACAAVGVASENLEEEVKVAVVLQNGTQLTERELLERLVEQLPYFMVPRYIELRGSLPYTETNKIRKSDLTSADGAWDRERHGIQVGRDGLRFDHADHERAAGDR